MPKSKLKGIWAAIPTPFYTDNNIDYQSYERHINWLLEQGVHGLVPLGTTGEGILLTHEERFSLLQCACSVVMGRVPIFAGTAGSTPSETVLLTQQAERAGVDGALIVTPWYICPSQEGLYAYYEYVHQRTSLPFMVYNNPRRTGVTIDIDTLERLSQKTRIVGIKDAGADFIRLLEIRHKTPERFAYFCGEDHALSPMFLHGAIGVISVAANVVPHMYCSLWKSLENENMASIKKMILDLYPLLCALNAHPNPLSIKYACHVLGFGEAHTRSMLGKMTEESAHILRQIVIKLQR